MNAEELRLPVVLDTSSVEAGAKRVEQVEEQIAKGSEKSAAAAKALAERESQDQLSRDAREMRMRAQAIQDIEQYEKASAQRRAKVFIDAENAKARAAKATHDAAKHAASGGGHSGGMGNARTLGDFADGITGESGWVRKFMLGQHAMSAVGDAAGPLAGGAAIAAFFAKGWQAREDGLKADRALSHAMGATTETDSWANPLTRPFASAMGTQQYDIGTGEANSQEGKRAQLEAIKEADAARKKQREGYWAGVGRRYISPFLDPDWEDKEDRVDQGSMSQQWKLSAQLAGHTREQTEAQRALAFGDPYAGALDKNKNEQKDRDSVTQDDFTQGKIQADERDARLKASQLTREVADQEAKITNLVKDRLAAEQDIVNFRGPAEQAAVDAAEKELDLAQKRVSAEMNGNTSEKREAQLALDQARKKLEAVREEQGIKRANLALERQSGEIQTRMAALSLEAARMRFTAVQAEHLQGQQILARNEADSRVETAQNFLDRIQKRIAIETHAPGPGMEGPSLPASEESQQELSAAQGGLGRSQSARKELDVSQKFEWGEFNHRHEVDLDAAKSRVAGLQLTTKGRGDLAGQKTAQDAAERQAKEFERMGFPDLAEQTRAGAKEERTQYWNEKHLKPDGHRLSPTAVLREERKRSRAAERTARADARHDKRSDEGQHFRGDESGLHAGHLSSGHLSSGGLNGRSGLTDDKDWSDMFPRKKPSGEPHNAAEVVGRHNEMIKLLEEFRGLISTRLPKPV